jgi:dihydrofolate synthase/folylpolyglutamate synthase
LNPCTPDDTLVAEHRDAALAWLLGRVNYEQVACPPHRTGQLKLGRMREILARLGQPQVGLNLIHVAGTKGKGSTAAMLASILTTAGYRTGMFSSPHLDRIEERMVVDGQPCEAAEFAELVGCVRPVVEAMDLSACRRGRDLHRSRPAGPTYFEITTALAILHFARRQVDAAVLEVGLGGRLDSTNVFLPRVSVITSISLDHTKQLGSNLSAIACEKAGIIKPGVSVVSGVTEPAPRGVIRRAARRWDCRLLEAARDFRFRYCPPRQVDPGPSWGRVDFDCLVPGLEHRYPGLKLRLWGHHQAANSAVALAAIAELMRQGWELSERAVRDGLAATSLPARVELLGRRPAVIVDSAHNVASAEALVRVLNESPFPRPRILVFASSRDKDIRGMLRVLGPQFNQIVLTRYEQNPRAASVDVLQALAREVTTASCDTAAHPAEAWGHLRRVVGPEHLVVIAGSFYIAAEMRRLVTANPLRPAPSSALNPA